MLVALLINERCEWLQVRGTYETMEIVVDHGSECDEAAKYVRSSIISTCQVPDF